MTTEENILHVPKIFTELKESVKSAVKNFSFWISQRQEEYAACLNMVEPKT